MNPEELTTLTGLDVPRETFERLEALVDFVRAEAPSQNLISRSTLNDIWQRHITDSVQLLKFSERGDWLDLGTGAGFPGLVIAAFELDRVVLVEERRLRHEFLSAAVERMALKNVEVIGSRVELVPSFKAQTISARAFAPLGKLLALSHRFSSTKTSWLLPKGKSAHEELASVRATWHGDFRLEPSVTDPTSSIIVASNVAPRGRL